MTHRTHVLNGLVRLLVVAGLLLSQAGFAYAGTASAQTPTPSPSPSPEPTATPSASPPSGAPLASTPEPTATPPATPASETTPTQEPDPTPTGRVASPTPGPQAEDVVTVTLDARGGAVTSRDGRVRLDVPPGLFNAPARVSIARRALDATESISGTLVRFDLTTIDVATGRERVTFDQPITLTLDLRGLEARSNNWFVAYRDPNDATVWHRVWAEVDDAAGLIRARTTHFSSWASGAEPGQWHYRWNMPTVSTFSGAATYNYPIDVPPGRKGLAPQVSLSYSSRGVDAHILSSMDQGPLGLGWSLNQIEIARDGVHMTNNDGGFIWYPVHPDAFSLVLDGSSYELKPEGSTASAIVRYYAHNAPHLFVQRIYNPGIADANPDKFYWVVKTPDGATYRLGYTPDSESGQRVTFPAGDFIQVYGHEGADLSYSGIRWRVDTVTDVYGSQIQYTYAAWDQDDGYSSLEGNSTIRTGMRRVSEIRYNYTTLAPNPDTRLTSAYGSRVEVASSPGQLGIKLYNVDLTTPTKIISASLQGAWHDTCGQSIYTQWVSSIQEFNGTYTTWLPATTFTYTPLAHAWGDCYTYEHLQEVRNGYGGRTRFTYASDGRKSHGWTCNCIPDYGYSFFVTKTETWDGVNAPPATVEYQPETPCYDQLDGALGSLPGAFNCQVHDGVPFAPYGHSPIVGFAKVTVTTKDYAGQVLNKTVEQFYQDQHKLGRAFQTQALDAGGVLLTQGDTAYTTAPNGPTTFTYARAVTQTTYVGAASRSTVVTYTYDAATGNRLAQFDYGDTAVAGDERSTHWLYSPNTSVWIIDKVARESVYEGLRSDTTADAAFLRSRTRYRYDNQCFTAAPLKGALTEVDRWNGGSATSSCDDPAFYTTRTQYDQWGNPTVNIDPLGNRITTTYESTYRLYPVQVANAKGHATQYQYYGVNGVPAGGYLPGLLKAVIDPNSQTTTYTYDTFGRLYDVYQPGDASGDPSIAYRYRDVPPDVFLSPFNVNVWRKPVTQKLVVRHFYDGLGREIQTHTAVSVTLSGYATPQDVVVSTRYDTRGLVVSQTVPYAVNAYVYNGMNPYTTVGMSAAPRTLTQYDALGRTKVITAPDGTLTKHYYGLDNDTNVGIPTNELTGQWVHSTTDANSHAKHYVQDAYGRLIVVRDFSGTCYPGSTGCTPQTQWTKYATTRYAYDTLGNLTRVTDTLTNTTVITYNPLGQKTGMIDPDMGAWRYEYDAAGNLITQTNALNQALWFKYDPLNRTVEKRQAGPNGSLLASYGYDTGANGIGQRTVMTDPSGSATWTYDARGRVVTETKTIAGAGTFTTAVGYDALDRVITTTYPTGEVVTQTYNAQGLLENVRSPTYGLSYASGLQYNALSQVTQMTYGNGELVRFGYRGAGGNWDSAPTSGLTSFGRLYRIRAQTSAGAPLFDLRYTYDAVGNMSALREAPRSASGWPTTFTFTDTFDTKDSTNWWWSAYQTVPFNDGGNNVVQSAGTNLNWNANFSRTLYSLTTGEGLQLRFKVDITNTVAHFSVEADDATYRRFGVIADGGKLYVQYGDGSGWRYPADLLTSLQVNTWYVLRMVVDDSGRGFYVEAYQESNPSVRGSFVQWMPTGKSWRFHHWVWRGSAYLDDYREFSTTGLTWTPDERMLFTYDHLDRLTSAAPESGAQGYSQTFQYNAIGNITHTSSLGNYTYPSSGPNSVRPHAVTTAGSNAYAYDANGNMLTRNESGVNYTQAWDAENRLAVVTNTVSGAVTQFTYDGDGARVLQAVRSGSIVTTTAYLGGLMEVISATSTSAPPSGDLIFADGFESGDFSAWSAEVDTEGDLNVTTAAALMGAKGMAALIDNTTDMYVRDDTPNAEPRYRARFYFDPNSVTIPSGNSHDIFAGRTASTPAFVVGLHFTGGTYQVYATIRDDGSSYFSTAYYTISDAPHTIEIDWAAASAPGANNGYLTLWIDGVLKETKSGIDNDTRRIEYGRLALTEGADSGTSGTEYYDAFESRRQTYIGPVQAPVAGSAYITKTYYFAGTQLVAMREITGGGSVLYYLHADHLGSTSLTTDSSGGEVARQSYYPFGTVRNPVGVMPTDIGFTGQRSDATTGLMFYNARYYSPVLGRFISPDTIVPTAGDPQSLNRYSYVFNNPLKYNDPSGHCPWCLIGALVGAAIGYGAQVVNNLNSGMDFGQALTTNIDPMQIVTGAVIGATVVAAAPVVVAAVGEAAIGVGLVTGSTTIFAAGTQLQQGATNLANFVQGAPATQRLSNVAKSLDAPRISSADAEFLQGVSDDYQCTFIVCGGRSETARGLANRAEAVKMQARGYSPEEIKAATGVPDWRISNPTGKPEFDYVAPGGLPQGAKEAIYNQWGQGVSWIDFFDDWGGYPQPKGGIVFSPGQPPTRNFLEPWQ